jgi:hypothetical protein
LRGLAAALALTLAACGRDGGRDGYVARVNSAVLTEADIVHQRDSLGETGAASTQYINDWVVNELLYQEAERRGLTDAAAFREQLDAMRKRLAVAALLQEAVYARVDNSALSEDSVTALFARSGQMYLLREDITLASYVVFRDRDAANTFRAAILRGAKWDSTLADQQSRNALKSPIVRSVSREFFSRSTLYPEELWKLARLLGREEMSSAVRTDEGYAILRTHQNFRQGELPPLEYARTEVRERLLMDLRRARYEEFLGSVRKRYSIDIRELNAGPDSSATKE